MEKKTNDKNHQISNGIIEFVKKNKNQYIDYHHWISGSSTIVYPITTYIRDDNHIRIEIQLGDCDRRNWRGFDSVLKKRFQNVKYAYYCQSDGSCPDVYRIELEF